MLNLNPVNDLNNAIAIVDSNNTVSFAFFTMPFLLYHTVHPISLALCFLALLSNQLINI